ncbi:MAG: DUF4345 family protein [Hyphomonadaceae bacterium]
MTVRIFLASIGVMFVGFGLWSLLNPLHMTTNLGVEIGGANGTFEMRGIFGGVSLGAAALCLAGAAKDHMVRPALWFLVAYMGGYCLARAASVALGDLPEPETWRFVAFEAVTLVIAILALRHRAK